MVKKGPCDEETCEADDDRNDERKPSPEYIARATPRHAFPVTLAIRLGGISLLVDSVIPQLKTLADGEFLRLVSLEIWSQPDLKSEDKSAAVADTMAAAIARMKLNTLPKKDVYGSYAIETTKSLANVKQFIRACLGRCDDIAGAVLKKMIQVDVLQDPSATSQYAQSVLIPLFVYVADAVQNRGTNKTSALLSELGDLANFSLTNLQVKPPVDTTTMSTFSRTLVNLVNLDGGWETFVFKALSWLDKLLSANDRITLMQRIHNAKTSRFIFGSVNDIVGTLAQHYAAHEDIRRPADALFKAIDYVGTRGAQQQAVQELFIRVLVVDRLKIVYFRQHLPPLLPRLTSLATRLNIADILTPAFETILLAWACRDGWWCPCPLCKRVTEFLLKNTSDKVLIMGKMNDEKKKHVKDTVEKHLPLSRGSFSFVSPSKKRLEVVLSDEAAKPVSWKMERAIDPTRTDLPRLPEINKPEVNRQVFTHRSYFARPTHIFEDPPDDPSPDNEISRMYNLPERLITHPAQTITLRASTNIQADLFESYVGGVYEVGGLAAVQSWLYPLFRPYIDQAYRCIRVQHGLPEEPVPIAAAFNHSLTPALDQLHPPGTWSTPAPARMAPSTGHLSLFNQHIQQERKSIEWVYTDSAKEGSKTTPIWVVKAMLQGQCLGRGKGSTKKAAKNEAAKEGLRALGVAVPQPGATETRV
ncbi:hypothetical protein EUX98_g7997 [Antrodiella citrinella]|uniref:DRBM domain-containing protein n=1 Tax=Antrodiella citrinella TaxID=2447956 RepID=A0A4S4MCG4_9APHY|nr:hypothetical protein EUX98_g7997 [Antrodiella citrinella]